MAAILVFSNGFKCPIDHAFTEVVRHVNLVCEHFEKADDKVILQNVEILCCIVPCYSSSAKCTLWSQNGPCIVDCIVRKQGSEAHRERTGSLARGISAEELP